MYKIIKNNVIINFIISLLQQDVIFIIRSKNFQLSIWLHYTNFNIGFNIDNGRLFINLLILKNNV